MAWELVDMLRLLLEPGRISLSSRLLEPIGA